MVQHGEFYPLFLTPRCLQRVWHLRSDFVYHLLPRVFGFQHQLRRYIRRQRRLRERYTAHRPCRDRGLSVRRGLLVELFGQVSLDCEAPAGVKRSNLCAEGVLGIGYTSNEVQVGRNGRPPYANLPKAMVQEGLIKSNAYSLWLNDLDSHTGSILFGGVNTGKYHGSLETLPVQKVNGIYSEFIIALTAVAVSYSSQTHNYSSSALPAAVLLDSGSSLTYLPDPIVADIFNDLGVSYDSSSGVGYVPCSLADQDVTVSFTFSSPTIHVAANELVLNAGDLYFRNGDRACVFGIVPAGRGTAVLGDTFLRSAYVVYDLANNEISLANTNFNSSSDNILEIGTGTDAVPGATEVSNPVTSVVAAGSGARIGEPSGGGGGFFTSSPASGNLAPARPTSMPKHLALGLAGAGALLAL